MRFFIVELYKSYDTGTCLALLPTEIPPDTLKGRFGIAAGEFARQLVF